MYLKGLEIHGFKSFAHKTEVEFAPGVTAIVGPNGCGKSNVVDSVRWVLGEQRAKALRSEKMQNIIFNGTSKRRQLGMAEVTMTIENTRNVLPTEYTEVTITRRLFRSGESEYLLNNTKCRLRDIQNLFMDTGMGSGAYSVIELKMIEEMLSENPQDRRRLFEEAAGITKYKRRRKQTLSKLNSTQADLTRIRDITEEVEKQVKSLERQAQKAARYKKHRNRLERLELQLFRAEFDRLMNERDNLSTKMSDVQDKLTALTTQVATEEAALEAQRTELVTREQALTERQRMLNAHVEKIRRLETELKLEQERQNSARRAIDRDQQEQAAAEIRKTELDAEILRLTESIEAAHPARELAESRLREAKDARDAMQDELEGHREALMLHRRQEQEWQQKLSAHQNQFDRLAGRLELMQQEFDRLTEQHTEMAGEETGLTDQYKHAESAVLEADEIRTEALNQVEADKIARTTLDEQLKIAHETLRTHQRERDALISEKQYLEILVNSYEEFSESVQFLAESSDWTTAPLQTISDIFKCADRDQKALKRALGDLASCFVVKTEAEALAGVQKLRHQGKGQAAFFVMERMPEGRQLVIPPPAGTASLAESISVTDPAFERLPALILGHFFITDSLENAIPHLRGNPNSANVRIFARTGESVDTRGVIKGGQDSKSNHEEVKSDSRPARRERLSVVSHKITELDAVVRDDENQIETITQQRDEIPFAQHEEQLKICRQQHHEAQNAFSRVQVEHDHIFRRRDEIKKRLTDLETEISAGDDEQKRLKIGITEAEANLAEAAESREAAEEGFRIVEAESQAIYQQFNIASVQAVEARNAADNLVREQERCKIEQVQLKERQESRQAEMVNLAEQIGLSDENQAVISQEVAGMVDEKVDQEEAVAEAETEVAQARAAISDREIMLREVRSMRETTMQSEQGSVTREAQIMARVETMAERITTEYELDLANLAIEFDDDFSEELAREDIPEIRRKIKGMGAVNELALESYKTEKERFDFMMEQQTDLEEAEKSLMTTIEEINTTASARFMETFEVVQGHFGKLFSDLFLGGEAKIHLKDPDDPLESVINVTAKPKGKKPSSISQLSGGEKTLTAIALLFAIYLVKPSPFCILDEVDAPLDDANVGRFMQLIREFSDRTQFILVTHNKLTMEAADRMYGITMQEQGVSNLVGVQLEDTDLINQITS